MKKSKQLIAVILAVLCVGLCFSSCKKASVSPGDALMPLKDGTQSLTESVISDVENLTETKLEDGLETSEEQVVSAVNAAEPIDVTNEASYEASPSEVGADAEANINTPISIINDAASSAPDDTVSSTDNPGINSFHTFNIDEFIEWVNNRGDGIHDTKAFFEAISKRESLVIPVTKDSNLFESMGAGMTYGGIRYGMHFQVLTENPADNYCVCIAFDLVSDAEKINLTDWHNSKYNKADVVYTAEKNNISYIYTDYATDQSGKRNNISKACFVYKGYIVSVQMYGTYFTEKTPFDEKLFDYFELKEVPINVK